MQVQDFAVINYTDVSNCLAGRIGLAGLGTGLWLSVETSDLSRQGTLSMGGGTAGGYLTVDSNLRIDRSEEITVDMGGSEYPLPEEEAVIQEPSNQTIVDL